MCKLLSLIVFLLTAHLISHGIGTAGSQFMTAVEESVGVCPTVPTIKILEDSLLFDNFESPKVQSIVQQGNGELEETFSNNKITVSCSSSKPIHWNRLPTKADTKITFTPTSNTTQNLLNGTTNCYSIIGTFEIPPNESGNGNYACLGPDETVSNDRKLHSSVYFSSVNWNCSDMSETGKLSHGKSQLSDDLQIQVRNSTSVCSNGMPSFACQSKQANLDGALRLKILTCQNPTQCNLLPWKADPSNLRTMPLLNRSSSSDDSCPLEQSLQLIICSSNDGSKYQVKYFLPARKERREPPRIVKDDGPSVIFLDTGVDKELTCVASGFPSPVINWLKVGNYAKDLAKDIEICTRREGNLTISTFKISTVWNFPTDLKGPWTCKASNSFGESVEHDVDVTVFKTLWIWISVLTFLCTTIALGFYVYLKQRSKKKFDDMCKYYGISIVELNIRIGGDKLLKEFKLLKKKFEDASHSPDELKKLEREFDNFANRHFGVKGINADNLLFGEELGEGAFGVVFGAKYTDPDGKQSDVAIKTHQMTHSKAENILNEYALLEEIQAIVHAGAHECLVGFVGVAIIKFEMSGVKLVAVLERCEKDLRKFLRNPPSFSTGPDGYSRVTQLYTTQDLKRWSYQIARAMQYLTSRKIIHRDLAARNVLLKWNKVTEKFDAKVTDFGVTKILKRNEFTYTTQWKKKKLPWDHAAPELLNGENKDVRFSQATDVWAFGMTLWEIYTLAKQEPFENYDYHDFINKIERGHMLDPMDLEGLESAHPEIGSIIQRCLCFDPNGRPKFADIAEELLSLIEAGEVPLQWMVL